ncbi:TonB family protein [Thiohalobacter sp. IOR34]|uniref:energy transducer TonB family protein n=1 Tax=Thiohalobacter sp. IOR34 TaxID=3057176 RepID=UPI0025B25A59|nr:TonB family protein [Thiohalobacter sp. IOR34]WJW75355.1 TonB family protein [Thiohalobacter sp. IOR34]
MPEAPPPAAPAAEADAETSYLARLLAHIERHKFYPRAARRRALEGEVEVSFELLADGRVRDLQLTGGARLLRNAARQAVQEALPLPRPPAAMRLPRRVEYRMRFELRQD